MQGYRTLLLYQRVGSLVIAFAQRHGRGFIFQDDNEPSHRARPVTDYLQWRSIRTMPWPLMSTDISHRTRMGYPRKICSETKSPSKDPRGAWYSTSRKILRVMIRRLNGSMRRCCIVWFAVTIEVVRHIIEGLWKLTWRLWDSPPCRQIMTWLLDDWWVFGCISN